MKQTNQTANRCAPCAGREYVEHPNDETGDTTVFLKTRGFMWAVEMDTRDETAFTVTKVPVGIPHAGYIYESMKVTKIGDGEYKISGERIL